MAGFTYKSYNFTDKDPIIDQVRTVIQNSGDTFKAVSNASGVSVTTIRKWLDGGTKRPQAASINAVLRALGYKLSVQRLSVIEDVKPTITSVRHIVQMAKYRKHK